MPGLVPGIHVFFRCKTKTWMAGSSPAMTKYTICPLRLSPRLHRPVGVAGLRHTAIERHVRMRAEPTLPVPRKYHGRAARPLKRLAVLVIARAGPGRDHDGHRGIGRRKNRGLIEIETEIRGFRPDMIPLRHPQWAEA